MIASRLEKNNLITNYQALPDDETFYHPSGIRMGVPEMTRFGMKEKEFATLGKMIADIVVRGKDIADEVAEFRAKFSTMQYCLGADETLKIAPAILESLFPNADYFQAMAASLKNL